MSLIGVQPRPDILLTIVQDWPTLPDDYIAHQIFLPFPVGVSTAPIPKLLRAANIERLYRPRYGAFPRGKTEVTSAGTYNCQEQGFEEPYDQKDIEIYKGEDGCQRAMGYSALNRVMLAHEYGVANALMTTTVFGTGYNQAAVAAWGSGTDKPLNDVSDAKNAVLLNCGNDANTAIIGAGLYNKLRKSAQIQNQLRAILGYTDRSGGIAIDVTPDNLALAFGLQRVLIGRGRYNSADDNQPAVMNYVWPSDKCLVAYIPAANDPMAPHLGRTFIWEEGLMELGGQAQIDVGMAGMLMENYYEQQGNIGVVRARKFLDTLLTNKDSGFLLTGC